MFAAVELGTNGFRLHVGKPVGARIQIVRSAHDPIRWADGVDKDGMLGAAASADALRCLAGFGAILKEYPLQAVRAVGTNTLRAARNTAAFLPLAGQALGYPIEIISGEEEGRLTYMGVARALARPAERRLVIDIGSGSTEIVYGHGDDIGAVESFGIGAHRQGASFFADGRVDPASFAAAVMSARARLQDVAGLYRARQWDAVYGGSGTVRQLGALAAAHAAGDGTLCHDQLLVLRDKLFVSGHPGALPLPGIAPGRFPALAGGLAVLLGVMQELGIARVVPVDAGLRLGLLSDLGRQAACQDRRDASVQAFMRRFAVDQARAARTEAIALRLYQQLGHGADEYCRLLAWACLLHEVGQAVSHSGAHRHAAYLIEHADLPGFTAREQRIISTLVMAQKGNLGKVHDQLAEPDFAKAVLALRLAVICMHADADRDVGELTLRMKARIELQAPAAWFARHPTITWWLDKEDEWWDEVDVPFVVRAA